MSTDYRKDIQFIRSLADLIEKSDLTEIEVERDFGDDDGMRVRLSKNSGQVTQVISGGAQMAAPAPVAAPAAIAASPAQETAVSEPAADDANMVTSPMVGTVYLAAEPGAANFVKVGDQVNEGQTLLIIEAMKTMNQIPSPRSGTVTQIVAENQQPIEFGAPLMIVE